MHSNGHKFYGAPLKTEAEAKQYINQVHQSSDSVTLIARPFTWIATPPTHAADSVLEDADPLQGAANWLVKAHSGLETSTLAGKLSIGYNRAKRLHDAAIAARKQGANHD